MNIAGHRSAAIQGLQGKSGKVQGNFSVFRVGLRPIFDIDAALGVSLNGAGADLIDEDFDPDPSWTEVGDSSVINGEVVSVIVAGSAASSQTTFASQTEVWMEDELKLDSGFLISSGDGVSLFTVVDGGTNVLRLDLVDSGGTLKFRTVFNEDVGQIANVVSDPVFVAGIKYTITLHIKAATTSSSDDGIVEIWIDTVKILDVQTVDNNSKNPDTVVVGATFAGSTVNGTIRSDDVKVGTTGASPAQITDVTDRSGNGNDVSQSTAVDQPLFNASDSDFNNNPSIEADGISELLIRLTFTQGAQSQPNNIFGVYKFISTAGSTFLFDGNSGTRHFLNLSTTNASMGAATGRGIHTNADTNSHVLSLLYNQASSNSWRDGIETTPVGDIGIQSFGGIILFRSVGVGFANAKLTRLVSFPSNLSDTAKNYIGRGFAARYGTTWTTI